MTFPIELKLANILKNFHRNTPHPEAEEDDIESAILAILRAIETNDVEHRRRVQDLLEANNRYLERARAAERELTFSRLEEGRGYKAGTQPMIIDPGTSLGNPSRPPVR